MDKCTHTTDPEGGIMKKQDHVKNLAITLMFFLGAYLLSLQFQEWKVGEHITTLFVFAVFLISLITDGYFYGVMSAIFSMFAINYAFTYPYFEMNFIIPSNLISAVIMVIIAAFTGTLTIKIKRHEVMKAEAEMERMRANLLRAVSHDLRTPLTTICGASATLLENRRGLTEEQQTTILRSIREDSDWLMRMVENLLSITRIDSERIRLIKSPMVVDELIDSVVTKFGKRYPALALEVEMPGEIAVVPMDAILVEQVLVNLLENAVFHAKGMTRLTLRVYTQDSQAVFELQDDGEGIREDRMKDLFSGRTKKEDSALPADGGRSNTGIGLSVCATIIRAHGGQIYGVNLPEGGALFRFTLDKEEDTDDE